MKDSGNRDGYNGNAVRDKREGNWNQTGESQPTQKRKPKFYVAGSVRGANGDNATREDMLENIKAGQARARYLRESLPDCTFYFPHDHEGLFQDAYASDYITSDQILNQCFDIVRLCDYVLVTTDPTESEGVNAEIDKAMEYGIEVLHVWQQAEHQWPQTIHETIKESEVKCQQR